MTQYEAIKAALTARGETLVHRHQKFEQWTRKFVGQRDAAGALIPAKIESLRFWFLAHRSGALRIGPSSGASLKVPKAAKAALVAEGKAPKA